MIQSSKNKDAMITEESSPPGTEKQSSNTEKQLTPGNKDFKDSGVDLSYDNSTFLSQGNGHDQSIDKRENIDFKEREESSDTCRKPLHTHGLEDNSAGFSCKKKISERQETTEVQSVDTSEIHMQRMEDSKKLSITDSKQQSLSDDTIWNDSPIDKKDSACQGSFIIYAADKTNTTAHDISFDDGLICQETVEIHVADTVVFYRKKKIPTAQNKSLKHSNVYLSFENEVSVCKEDVDVKSDKNMKKVTSSSEKFRRSGQQNEQQNKAEKESCIDVFCEEAVENFADIADTDSKSINITEANPIVGMGIQPTVTKISNGSVVDLPFDRYGLNIQNVVCIQSYSLSNKNKENSVSDDANSLVDRGLLETETIALADRHCNTSYDQEDSAVNGTVEIQIVGTNMDKIKIPVRYRRTEIKPSAKDSIFEGTEVKHSLVTNQEIAEVQDRNEEEIKQFNTNDESCKLSMCFEMDKSDFLTAQVPVMTDKFGNVHEQPEIQIEVTHTAQRIMTPDREMLPVYLNEVTKENQAKRFVWLFLCARKNRIKQLRQNCKTFRYSTKSGIDLCQQFRIFRKLSEEESFLDELTEYNSRIVELEYPCHKSPKTSNYVNLPDVNLFLYRCSGNQFIFNRQQHWMRITTATCYFFNGLPCLLDLDIGCFNDKHYFRITDQSVTILLLLYERHYKCEHVYLVTMILKFLEQYGGFSYMGLQDTIEYIDLSQFYAKRYIIPPNGCYDNHITICLEIEFESFLVGGPFRRTLQRIAKNMQIVCESNGNFKRGYLFETKEGTANENEEYEMSAASFELEKELFDSHNYIPLAHHCNGTLHVDVDSPVYGRRLTQRTPRFLPMCPEEFQNLEKICPGVQIPGPNRESNHMPDICLELEIDSSNGRNCLRLKRQSLRILQTFARIHCNIEHIYFTARILEPPCQLYTLLDMYADIEIDSSTGRNCLRFTNQSIRALQLYERTHGNLENVIVAARMETSADKSICTPCLELEIDSSSGRNCLRFTKQSLRLVQSHAAKYENLESVRFPVDLPENRLQDICLELAVECYADEGCLRLSQQSIQDLQIYLDRRESFQNIFLITRILDIPDERVVNHVPGLELDIDSSHSKNCLRLTQESIHALQLYENSHGDFQDVFFEARMIHVPELNNDFVSDMNLTLQIDNLHNVDCLRLTENSNQVLQLFIEKYGNIENTCFALKMQESSLSMNSVSNYLQHSSLPSYNFSDCSGGSERCANTSLPGPFPSLNTEDEEQQPVELASSEFSCLDTNISHEMNDEKQVPDCMGLKYAIQREDVFLGDSGYRSAITRLEHMDGLECSRRLTANSDTRVENSYSQMMLKSEEINGTTTENIVMVSITLSNRVIAEVFVEKGSKVQTIVREVDDRVAAHLPNHASGYCLLNEKKNVWRVYEVILCKLAQLGKVGGFVHKDSISTYGHCHINKKTILLLNTDIYRKNHFILIIDTVNNF